MATITSATSGLASATSTWVGGVVPGTTFAGTRTTTGAAVALGATSIPVSSGAQAVTAGKRIKVAGDPNTYRVATGVAGGSAGNIIIDAPGLLVAIPASATTVSVDMVDDKVIIAHPGTNILSSSNLYVVSGLHAIGATSIALVSGTGTIAAGECVQFDVQVGVDEDGSPVLHNGYYKAASGFIVPGSLQIEAPGLLVAVPGGTQVINAGHVVTLDGTTVWGDDSSSATIESNAIVVRGTLRASRTASSKLTCRGTCAANNGATYDFGADDDPIPDAINAVVEVNDSSALVVGKHIFGTVVTLPTGLRVRAVGKRRTRNTRLTSATTNNATTIEVDESVGWQVGDRVVLASPTDDPAGAQTVTITGGAAPIWTVTAVTAARLAGCRVGNLSSNVSFRAASANHNSSVCFGSGSSAARARVVDVAFVNAGSSAGWLTSQQPENIGSLGFRFAIGAAKALRVAVDKTNAAGNGAGVATNQRSLRRPLFEDCAVIAGSGGYGSYCGQLSRPVFNDCVLYSCSYAVFAGFGGGSSPANFTRGASWSVNGICFNNELATVEFDDFESHQRADLRLFQPYGGVIRYRGGSISGGSRFMEPTVASAGVIETVGTTFATSVLDGSNVAAATPAQECLGRLTSVNGVASDNRVLSHYQTTRTDTATRKRSTYSVKIQPNVANTAITYVFTTPAVAGVQQTIKGALRFDATYGTATPPRIDLSGQGVTQSHTCAATADAWDDFTLTFTPASTGDITATVTVQSASTAGFAWLDGIYHYPMTQSVRHYGYQFLAQAALVANDKLTVTNEATVLAYPVTVDHGTGTITITGNATATQIGDYLEADLCQTANQAQAVHYTLGVGGAFTTSYNMVVNTGCTVTGNFTTTGTVTLTGTATVAGVYTSAAGQSTYLTLTGLVGATVAVYDGSGAQYALATPVTGTFALSIPPGQAGTWAWKTARYGYMAQGATFAPNTGAVTAAPTQLPDSGITQATAATVAAYASLDSPDQIYDYLAYWETTAAGIATARLAAKSGSACDLGAKKLVLDAGAASLLAWSSGTSTLTLKAGAVVAGSTMSELIATGAALSLVGGASTGSIIFTDSLGRHVRISAPGLIAGTWCYLYNVSDDTLISKTQLSSAGLSLPVVYAADKTIEYRFGYSDATTRKYLVRGTGVLSSSGLQIIGSQVDDPVYAAISGDPATFTEFAPDFPNLQVDTDETFLVPRLYKWVMWAEASSDGIELMAGAVSSDDGTNVRINVDVVDAMIQNPNAGTNIFARGGYIYRSDGSGWIVPGPGIITPDFGRAYTAPGTSGATAAEVWAYGTRELTGPAPLVLDNGEQLMTVKTVNGAPKYLSRG